MPRLNRSKMKPGPDYHPIHDSVFGPNDEIVPMNEDALPGSSELELVVEADEDEPKPMVDDTPSGASRARVYMDSPGEPGRFQPMRDVGDTDPTDRQPDGTLRR